MPPLPVVSGDQAAKALSQFEFHQQLVHILAELVGYPFEGVFDHPDLQRVVTREANSPLGIQLMF